MEGTGPIADEKGRRASLHLVSVSGLQNISIHLLVCVYLQQIQHPKIHPPSILSRRTHLQ